MKKLLTLLTFLWVYTTCLPAQQTIDAVGLIGTIVDPTGKPVNGELTLALSLANVKNTCTPPPYQVAPRGPITFKVINGVIVGGSTAKIVTQDCMNPRTAYFVSLYDTNHKLLFADNWYLHQEQVTNMVRAQDVGTMASESFGGPIVVALGQGVVTNPQGNQTITQPAGTNLIINSAICTGTCIGFGGGGGSGGGVSSVGLQLPSIFNVTQSPITSSGNLIATLSTEPAGTLFAGPLTGADATPSFRLLGSPDIPNNAANTTGTSGNVTGIVAVVNGGTGTATPSLVSGTGITISGSFPNQTVNSSLVGTGSPSQLAVYGAGGVVGGDPNVTDSGSLITISEPVFLSTQTPSLCLATDASSHITTVACGGMNSPTALMPALGSFVSAASLNFGGQGGYAVVTGTNTVSTIVVPAGCSGGSIACTYALLSSSGFKVQISSTGGSTNNINGGMTGPGEIVTIPAGSIVNFTYDPVNGLWHYLGNSVDASTELFGIVSPTNIADSSLTATTVLHNTYFQGAWNSAQSYNKGEMATFGGQTFTSLVAANINNNPPASRPDWASLGLACGQALCLTPPSITALVVNQAIGDTTATLNSIGNFSNNGGCFFIDTEYECYQYATGNLLVGITRGAYNTAPAAHTTGSLTGVQGVVVLGASSIVPSFVVTAGYATPTLVSINNPYPNSAAGSKVFSMNSGTNETFFDTGGAIHQVNNNATNVIYGPVQVSSLANVPTIVSSGYILQGTGSNEAFFPIGFGGGIAGSVNITTTPNIAAPILQDFTSGGSTTRTYVCSATDFDGNLIPGTPASLTTAGSFTAPQFISVVCPWSAGIASFQMYRTVGGPNQGLLSSLSGFEGAQVFDFNQSATAGSPPVSNGSKPKLSIAGSTHSSCDTSTVPQTCMILGIGIPTGCGTTYGLGSSYGNETGTLATLFFLCSPPGTNYNVGQSQIPSGTNIPGNNFINSVYQETGTNSGGYTVSSGSVYVGTGGTNGDKIDIGIIAAPTSATQATSWLCHGTYTETSTPPSAYITVPITSCGTLPPNTFYWVAYDTNDAGVSLGNYNCGSSCSGAPGTSTYGSRYVAATYGTYTGLTTSLSGPNPTQASEYITLSGLADEWVNSASNGTININGGSGGGSGTVTSVALALPSVFTVSGSPVNTVGTLTGAFATGQTANMGLFTPSGSTGALSLRAIVAADLPTFGTSAASIVGASGGGTTNFLRADGVWTTPAGGGGAPAFSSITSATNTTAALVLGTGSSLTVSGGGTNNATSLNGNTYPGSSSFTQYSLLYATSTSSVSNTAADTNVTHTLFATSTVPAFRAIGINDWGSSRYVAAAGSVNVLTATLSPAATALFNGMEVEFLPNLANTSTTPTLNVNGLGNVLITKLGHTALATNDLTTVAIADVIYDGTDWQLQNPQAANAGGGGPIFIHNLSGATPTVAVNSSTVPAMDIEYLPMSANVTSITLPAAAAIADGEIIKLILYQPASGGPWTLPSATAISPLTAGSGTTLINTVPSGCPTIGTTQSSSTPSQLFISVGYQTSITQYQILGCTTGTPTQAGVVEWNVDGSVLGNVAVNTVIASTSAKNSGKFYNLQIVTATSGTCTTPPTFNVFDGTTNTGIAITAGGSIETKGVSVNQGETLPINAGDTVGVYVSTAGSGCPTPTFLVTGQIQEP